MPLCLNLKGAVRAARVWAAEQRVDAARLRALEHPSRQSVWQLGQAQWDLYVARNGEPRVGSGFYKTTRRWLL